jgi:hemerythrin HHE cation binding domain-containing protein
MPPRRLRRAEGKQLPKLIHEFLSRDHERLDALLARATSARENIDMAAYGEFRAGLLRHIAMEEKVLLPAVQESCGGLPLPVAKRLRLDHGALAALLVPTPTAAIVATIQRILRDHNRVEESPGGVYETCERLAGAGVENLLLRLRAVPAVLVARHKDGPLVMDAARRALLRAGYSLGQ